MLGIASLICIIIAGTLFGLAAMGFPSASRFNLVAGGLFIGVLGMLLERLP